MTRIEALAQAQSILNKAPFSKEDKAKTETLLRFAEVASENGEAVYQARAAIAAGKPVVPVEDPYSRAFRAWMLNGDGALSPSERNVLHERRDMGTGGEAAYPGATAGYFAPILFSDAVESAKKFASDFFVFSTIIPTMSGAPLPYPDVDDTANAAEQASENTSLTSNAVNVGGASQVVLYAYKYSAKSPAISIELAQDAYNDFESWLIEQFAIRIARGAAPKLLLGNGRNNTTGSPPTPAPEPMGLLTAATWTSQTVIGNDNLTTPDPRTQVGVTDLITLQTSVDVAYRRKAGWLMHPTTMDYIRNLRDTVGYLLWGGGLGQDVIDPVTGTSRAWLLGNPVYLSADMPQLGPGAKAVVYGDLSKYVIRRLRALTVLRKSEFAVEKGQLQYICFDRLDGNLLTAGRPVKYLQLAS